MLIAAGEFKLGAIAIVVVGVLVVAQLLRGTWGKRAD